MNNNNNLFVTDINELYGGLVPARQDSNLLGNNPIKAQQLNTALNVANQPANKLQQQGYSLMGLGRNIVSNLEDIGTGLAYVGTHPKETGQLLLNYLNDVGYQSGGNPLKNLGYIAADATDAILHPYSLDSATRNENLGNIVGSLLVKDYSGAWNYTKDAVANAADRAYNNAGYVGVDLLSLGLGKGLTAGARAATSMEKGLATTAAESAKIAERVREPLGEINRLPVVTRAKLFEAAETGKWTDDIAQYKPLVKKFSEEYNNLIPEYAKVDREKQSIIQKYVRDNNITYQEAERALTPLLENATESTSKNIAYHYSPEDFSKFDINKVGTGAGARHGEGIYVTQNKAIHENAARTFDELNKKLGQRYKVEIPNDETFLRESTRLIDQPAYIQDAVRNIANKTPELKNIIANNPTGKEIIEALGKDAVKILDKNEIKGIKYYEGLPSEGLNIFNPNDIRILEKGVKNGELVGFTSSGDNIAELAKAGDKAAQAVIEGKKLFKQGDIFPITHAMESADDAAKAAGFINEVGSYAGKYSKRGYGLTTYEKMAEGLVKQADGILENQMRAYTQSKVGQQIIDGHIGGQSIAPASIKDAVYVSKSALENGDVLKVLKNPSKEPLKSVDSIAIDKNMAKTIVEQLTPLESAYKGWMKDIYTIQKGNLLAQGTYLAGNTITGATNTLVNSGFRTIDDVVQAIGTKGKLAKRMGLYRRDIPKTYNNKVVQTIQNINDLSGARLFRHLDRTIQNSIAEIAAHANLRKQGIKAANRLNTLDELSLDKLGEAIVDTRRVALLNSNRTILPRGASQLISTFSPFWQWGDTAAQSTLWMLRRNPAMANVALIDVLSTVGFNAEMQNRFNLKVTSDKPLVSYRFDNRTGQIKEATAEFVPMMNTLRFISDSGRASRGEKADSINFTNTALGEIFMAAQGKNRYGKPLRSQGMVIQGDKRYRQNPQTGQWELVETGTAGEVLTAIGRTTFGLPNVINKTVAPTVAEAMSILTGKDYNFYRPDDDSLFGQILPQGQAPTLNNILIGGDPTRPRTGREIQNALSGVYETPYFPERPDITSQRQLRSILLNRARSYNRGLENINR